MKKLTALFFMAAVALGTSGAAHAQELKAKIPFDFVVAGNKLPASTYNILRALPNDDRGLAFVGEGKGLLARATAIDDTATGTNLVFRQIGGEYVLTAVVTLRGTLNFPVSAKMLQRSDERMVAIPGR
ncbi:MAG TPA: hypothetical protein VFQ00_01465 [Terriglobales bacterium]|nr:hypothetical protein [Terriglobales bacterium]